MPCQYSRKKSSASLVTPRSSPGRSVDMSRSDVRSENKSSTKIEIFKQWVSDVTSVMDRPTICLPVIAIGVFFIILASNQVKLVFDNMELWGFDVQILDGFNYMAVFVFFFVWLDIFLLSFCARWLIHFTSRAWSYAWKIKASMKEVENKERSHNDKNRKK